MRSSPEKKLIREIRKEVAAVRSLDNSESVQVLADVINRLLQKIEEQYNTILNYEITTEDVLLKKGYVLPSKDGTPT